MQDITEEGNTLKRKGDETWATAELPTEKKTRPYISLSPPSPTHSFPLPPQEAVSPVTLQSIND